MHTGAADVDGPSVSRAVGNHWRRRDASLTPSDDALWILASDDADNPVGCGALLHVSPDTAELKRMFSTRQRAGTGAALLAAIEQLARQRGYKAIRLSTRVINTRAVAFYQRQGYQETDRYGVYVDRPASVCLSKTL
ncbi:GNAT family N-acetyltransferase [Pantoea allii]|uniref:GNAT family N-acetyltransferase n=1 Tax=Pantoea TaxID=53335 RepID=UPI000AD3C2C2|nr:GNAT family N-acetyltransferase [Pantoea sp. OXWO6B1]